MRGVPYQSLKKEYTNQYVKKLIYIGRIDYYIKGLDLLLDAIGDIKEIINELPISDDCHLLSNEELHRLQRTMLAAYKEIEGVCKKHGIAIAMGGGNAIGAN